MVGYKFPGCKRCDHVNDRKAKIEDQRCLRDNFPCARVLHCMQFINKKMRRRGESTMNLEEFDSRDDPWFEDHPCVYLDFDECDRQENGLDQQETEGEDTTLPLRSDLVKEPTPSESTDHEDHD